MNKLFFALGALALLGTAFFVFEAKTKKLGYSEELIETFEQWKLQYGKKYSDPDYNEYRMNVFAANLMKIRNHSNPSYTVGMTQFMDLTPEEFKAFYLGYINQQPTAPNTHMIFGTPRASAIDWRTKGDAVLGVEDQGQCGSCWAFSTAEGVEGIYGVKEAQGHGVSLSKQQLVDCSSSYGNMGCNGGLMDYGFQYAADKGLTTTKAYPYQAYDQDCQQDGGDYKISGFTDVPQGDCDALADALQDQPISVAVDAENWSFYTGGIFDDCSDNLDHGVLLVAVGNDGTWTIKNSWNTFWGEQGFIRLKAGNTCGLCNAASYPNLEL